MKLRSILPVALLAASALFVAACGGDETAEGDLPDCPEGGTDLTYDNFGQAFFESHCTSCHAAGGQAGDRPFESLSEIAADIEEIYEQAGGSNDSMPPNGGPTADERAQLAEWLSCGAK